MFLNCRNFPVANLRFYSIQIFYYKNKHSNKFSILIEENSFEEKPSNE